MESFSISPTVVKTILRAAGSCYNEDDFAATSPIAPMPNIQKSLWENKIRRVASSLSRIFEFSENDSDSQTKAIRKDSGFNPFLPTEILLDIFAHFRGQRRHLKSARLVCRAWFDPATEILFETVVLSPHRQNILVLQEIINHPRFPHLVKNIVYDASAFLFLSDQASYRSELEDTILGKKKILIALGTSGGKTSARFRQWAKCDLYCAEGWHKYFEYYNAQNTTPPYITSYLMDRCVEAFPNLEKVVVQSSWNCEWGAKGIIRYSGPGILARTWDPRVLSPKPISPAALENDRANWPLAVIGHSLQIHGRSIKSVVFEELLGYSNTLNWALKRNYVGLQDIIETPLMYLMSGLEELALNGPLQPQMSFNQLQRSNPILSRILASAENLRYLELTDWSVRSNQACLKYLIFPRLETFALMNGTFSPEELMVFLFNQSQTLKKLQLINVNLNGHWAPLIDFIHDHMLSLTQVLFYGYPREWREDNRRRTVQLHLMPPRFKNFKKRDWHEWKWLIAQTLIEDYCLRRTGFNWLNEPGIRVAFWAPVWFSKLQGFKIASGAEATKMLSLPRSRHA